MVTFLDPTVSWPNEASVCLILAGVRPYREAMQLQKHLWQARCRDLAGDTLLLLQHPPVITLGVSGGQEDLRVSSEQLQHLGVELFQTNRGGRATFHGPGQLVAYPVMKLYGCDLHAYLWKLEEVVLRLLQDWGIRASRDERFPGVWVGKAKIAAVGVAVRDDVSTHGLALNANTDLSYFGLITPCGLLDRGVTSMQAVLGQEVPMAELEAGFARVFAEVFNRTLKVSRAALEAELGLVDFCL